MLAAIPFVLTAVSTLYVVRAVPILSTSTTTSAPSAPTPSTVTSYNGWTSVGCYVDYVNNRQLEHPEATVGGTQGMTVEVCLDACYADGYTFAGLEYSQECYCGYSLPPQPATDGRCDMTCNGNSLEYCGGSNGLGVYQLSGTPSTTTTTSTSTSAPATTTTQAPPSAPTTVQSYNGYTFSNCYVDSVSDRVLPEIMSVQGSMTVEKCIDACYAAGYEFAGVEYSQECYCGRVSPTVVATDGRCDMTCAGDSSEYCGGSNGIDVYDSNSPSTMPHNVEWYDGWTYTGCFVDSVGDRQLPVRTDIAQDPIMTVELCLDACQSAGYMYAGLEYHQECYCGNSLPPQEATDGRCDMTCNGNPEEYCGGSNGLSVYTFEPTTTYTTTYTLTTTSDQQITVATTEVVPVTITTTDAEPYTYLTTIAVPLTDSTTIAVPITGSTTITEIFPDTTTIAVPITGTTTFPTLVPGSTSIVEPAAVSTTVATIVSVPSESLTVFESISRTLSILTGTTSFADAITTIYEPVIILTTLSKTLTISTEVPVLVPTTSYEIIPEPTITTVVVPALVVSDVTETYTTTSFDLEPAVTTSFDIEPATSTSFDIEPAPTTSYDIEPVTTTTYGVGVGTTSTSVVEPVTTTTEVIYPYTTVTTTITTEVASTSAP